MMIPNIWKIKKCFKSPTSDWGYHYHPLTNLLGGFNPSEKYWSIDVNWGDYSEYMEKTWKICKAFWFSSWHRDHWRWPWAASARRPHRRGRPRPGRRDPHHRRSRGGRHRDHNHLTWLQHGYNTGCQRICWRVNLDGIMVFASEKSKTWWFSVNYSTALASCKCSRVSAIQEWPKRNTNGPTYIILEVIISFEIFDGRMNKVTPSHLQMKREFLKEADNQHVNFLQSNVQNNPNVKNRLCSTTCSSKIQVLMNGRADLKGYLYEYGQIWCAQSAHHVTSASAHQLPDGLQTSSSKVGPNGLGMTEGSENLKIHWFLIEHVYPKIDWVQHGSTVYFDKIGLRWLCRHDAFITILKIPHTDSRRQTTI